MTALIKEKPMIERDLRLAILGLMLLLGIPNAGVLGQQAFIVELRSGMRLGPGTVEPVETVSISAAQRATSGEVSSKPIDMLNDGLRKTYYNASPRNVINSQPVAFDRSNVIEFPAAAEVTKSGGPQSFQGIDRISAFNRNGRRTLIVRLPNNSSPRPTPNWRSLGGRTMILLGIAAKPCRQSPATSCNWCWRMPWIFRAPASG
jgi:hypothetical protein